MTAIAVVVMVLVVLLVVLAVGWVGLPRLDRRCALLAEQRAGQYVSGPFGHPATVQVLTRPFLPQAVRGIYRDIEVLGALRFGQISGATLVAHLTNVHLPLRELLGRRVQEVPCERVTGRLVLPYAELAALARIPALVLAFDGERLVATIALSPAALPVSVPGFGQLARVSGEAVLSLRGGQVWLGIRGVSVAGIALPVLVLSQLLPALEVPIALPALPYGLQLDHLQPTATGLVVDGSADAVVFRRPAPSPSPSVDS